MKDRDFKIKFLITLILVAAGLCVGFISGLDSVEEKQRENSVIIQQWGDELYLLINPRTGGFYSDHKTLEEATLAALEMYEEGKIGVIIFDLNRDGKTD